MNFAQLAIVWAWFCSLAQLLFIKPLVNSIMNVASPLSHEVMLKQIIRQCFRPNMINNLACQIGYPMTPNRREADIAFDASIVYAGAMSLLMSGIAVSLLIRFHRETVAQAEWHRIAEQLPNVEEADIQLARAYLQRMTRGAGQLRVVAWELQLDEATMRLPHDGDLFKFQLLRAVIRDRIQQREVMDIDEAALQVVESTPPPSYDDAELKNAIELRLDACNMPVSYYPSEFICPLTHSIMANPVSLRLVFPTDATPEMRAIYSQHIYDETIIQNLAQKICPITHLPFTSYDVNESVKIKIEKFVKTAELHAKVMKEVRLKASAKVLTTTPTGHFSLHQRRPTPRDFANDIQSPLNALNR